MGFNWRSSFAIVAVLLLGVSSLAVAQTNTGNLYVVVADNEGAKLPGVTVTVTGQGAPKVAVSTAGGDVRFLGLDPGRVDMVAQLEGFSTVEYPQIEIRAGRNVSVEVTLSPAVEEVITVTSESPLLDSRKVQAGTTVTQVELEKIPTARDPWAILNQTPGVLVDRINVGGNESGQQASFVGPGVTDDENSFLVDGVEITDMAAVGASSTYFDFDQFTEMQFGTGGADVTKHAAGVGVNLITKRGTNEFRGSARIFRTDDNMFDTFTQSVPFIQQPDSELGAGVAGSGVPQSGFIGNSINQVTEYGVEAGGPVIRDRLWFWGSFGTNDIRNRTGGSSEADIQNDDTILENTAFKVNAQISSNNSAIGSWNNGDKKKFGRNAGPSRPQPTTWDQRGPSAIIKFEDTHVFSSNLFLTGSYGKVDGGFGLTSKACIAAGDCVSAPETLWDADGVWQDSYLSGSSSRPSEEWKIDGSYFFNTGDISHELKVGGRLRDFETVSPFHWPGRDTFHIDGAQFGFPDGVDLAIGHRGETPLITQEYQSIWVQDTITAGNFTVNAGFRYDVQDGRNEQYSVPENPAFPTLLPSLTFGGADAVFDWDDISPRIGVTYALGEERKTLIRGSYSQFPEQLETTDIFQQNPLGDAYATFIFYDNNGDQKWFPADGDVLGPLIGFSGFDPSNPNAVTTKNRTDPGLSAPLTQELILGVEHAFLPEFVVGAQFTMRETDDILSNGSGEFLREIIVDPVTGVERPTTAADYGPDGFETGLLPNGQPYNIPRFAITCGSACRTGGDLLENTDRAVEYQGFNLNFIKRLSNQWMLRGFFNYGDAEWDVPGSYKALFDPNNFEGGFDDDGGLFGNQATGSGAKGDVFIQSTWQYNVNGMYQVAPDRPWGFNVAANIYGREGTPLPYYERSTLSDGLRRDIQLTPAVDTFRTDDILTVDLRLEKEFAATGGVGFTASIDIFNIFDETYTLQRFRRLNSGQADWLRETLSPRIWRLGVRLNWK